MGCFDSTCAFTRTSVSCGDEVLLVGIKPREPYPRWDTYNLADDIYRFNITTKQNEEMIELEKKYEGLTLTKYDVYNPIRFAVIGSYDDYGSVEVNNERFDNETGLDEKYTYYDWQFFVHKSVVDSLIGYTVTNYDNLTDVVTKLVNLAFIARIQLACNCLLGQQHYDKQEIELQRKLLNLTDTVLANKALALQEYDDD